MFQSIETTSTTWPKQLLFGTVLGLAKCRDAHEEGQFRPITLFSVLFRCWSRLRTKHMLMQLAQYMPAETLGFLPHREASELWLLLQGQIEVMLAYDEPLCGLSSDIRRAFNHIGRKQVFYISQHLGYPEALLNAWTKFLSNFTRRFDVHGCLGQQLESNSGFPEGDPLSIVAMLTVNWGYHVYMKLYAPRVQAYSFVDNLTLAAKEACSILQGHFAMVSYSELFGLSLDADKTFVWGLTLSLRKALQRLGFPCLFEASELGASMTYGCKIRNRLQKARGTGLEGKWQKLRRSFAPFPQKIAMLARVFWPKVLRGAPSCVFADHHLLALRRAATKALQINGAGSNPLLRLSLADDMQTDPGFYQLMYCISTMRRLLRKKSDLLPMWKAWHQQFVGKILPGPFSKLLLCLNQIGWRVTDPPFVCDHEQHTWNLITVDTKTLQLLLADAWCQYLATMTNHKTMFDLAGMDFYLTTLEFRTLLPLERALLSALQSGAFISADEHAKYDIEKSPMCPLCDCEDDRAHWLSCPRFQHLRQAIPGWHPDNVRLPSCMRYHLLVPRLQLMVDWRCALLQIQDRTNTFLFDPPIHEIQHVFIDGSCTTPVHPALRLAAWGVISATANSVVAYGHLCGVTQTIDRAELTALVVALRWSTTVDLCIWSDSLSNVQIAEYIQQHDQVPLTVENYDLWLAFHDALVLRSGLLTLFRWIPSHVHPDLAEDPYEAWVFTWNGLVDQLVSSWNLQRDVHLMQLHASLASALSWWSERVRQLRSFYFQVAAYNHQGAATSVASHPIDMVLDVSSEDDPIFESETIADQLPVNLQVQCRQTSGSVPGSFVMSVLQWLCAAEQLENCAVVVSDLEFLFMLILDDSFEFPFQLDGSTSWTFRKLVDLFQTPTITMLLRTVQMALQQICILFPDLEMRTPSCPAKELGVYIPMKGLKACFPRTLVRQARERIIGLTSQRPVKRTGDLARPVT
eukprot:s772_g21.t1